MKVSRILAVVLALTSLSLPACDSTRADEKEAHLEHRIITTSPKTEDVIITQPYVCQIHAQQHIEVRAFEEGFIEEIDIKEGQWVKKDDVMFKIFPALFTARLAKAKANLMRAQVALDNTKKLNGKAIVSDQEVKLYEAELNNAKAEVNLAQAELNFTTVRAAFDGIIDRQYQQLGSLVKKEDLLTTLSDTSVMWVYFNVPEARYFEFKTRQGPSTDHSRLELVDSTIELRLADGSKFKYNPGNFVTVEGQFNNETGNIKFRADFPNPDHLLRHGQTGTILIHRAMRNAIVIPQRATFEILDKQFVWVVGEDHVVHQRPITIEHELEDIFVIKSGLGLKDKIILEGVRQVHEGDKLEDVEFQKPEDALATQKHYAE